MLKTVWRLSLRKIILKSKCGSFEGSMQVRKLRLTLVNGTGILSLAQRP